MRKWDCLLSSVGRILCLSLVLQALALFKLLKMLSQTF